MAESGRPAVHQNVTPCPEVRKPAQQDSAGLVERFRLGNAADSCRAVEHYRYERVRNFVKHLKCNRKAVLISQTSRIREWGVLQLRDVHLGRLLETGTSGLMNVEGKLLRRSRSSAPLRHYHRPPYPASWESSPRPMTIVVNRTSGIKR